MRIGWRFVRGIGDTVLDALEAARKDGPFTSIRDVVRRAKLDRDEVLAFAQADAFAAWAHGSPSRRVGGTARERRRPAARAGRRDAARPGSDHDDELVFLDYHAVGMSIAGHPMASVRDKLVRGGAIDTRDLMKMPNGRKVTIGGLVTVRQRPATAGGTIFLSVGGRVGLREHRRAQAARRAERGSREARALRVGAGTRRERRAAISIVGQQFKTLDVEGGALTHRAHEFR